MILKSFEIPLYRGNIIVVIESNVKELQRIISKFDDEVIYAHTYYSEFDGCQGFYIVLNFKSEFRKITHGTIAHEAVHAANMILFDRGIIADFNNDEAHTYLTDWIVDSVYKVLKENKLKPV